MASPSINRLLPGLALSAALVLPAGLHAERASPAAVAAVPAVKTLQQWHADKAAGGPTFAGNPAWHAHLRFIEESLADRGVLRLERTPVPYRRWFAGDAPDAGDRALTIGDESIPVAAYWAYSGSTDASGVTAPLHLYAKGDGADELAGKIVVFEVGDVPPAMFEMFRTEREYANYEPEDPARSLASSQWYQGNYVVRFGRFDQRLRDSGAAGAVVIFDMPAARARGLYTFPLLRPGTIGVPGLYVDREAGVRVRAAAIGGQAATLRLQAREEDAAPYFLHGVLPGARFGQPDDELVLLITHSDGPNLTQENGTLAIVAMIEALAVVPQSQRRRSVLVLIDPQHYMPGRHQVDWHALHPALAARIVASIGVEQLGQREYGMTTAGYGLNGRAEPTLIFAQDNDRLIDAAIDIVKTSGVPRVEVRVPSRGGQGMWQGLGDIAIKRNLPGFAMNTNMSGYWTTTPGLESFDADLCRLQIVALVRMTQILMDASLDDIAVPVRDPKRNPAMSPGVDR